MSKITNFVRKFDRRVKSRTCMIEVLIVNHTNVGEDIHLMITDSKMDSCMLILTKQEFIKLSGEIFTRMED